MEAIIIPKDQAYLFKQVNITHWDGIDAVEIKDGSFIISKSDYERLPKDICRLDKLDNSVCLKTKLVKYTIKNITVADLKETIIGDDLNARKI